MINVYNLCFTVMAASGGQSGGNESRPQFGNRFLKDGDDVFQHSAWDNVQWDAAQEELAKCKVTENSSVFASESDQEKYEVRASEYWDAFYGIHQNRFFKDRQWLFTEFPELVTDNKCVKIKKEQVTDQLGATDDESTKPYTSKNTQDGVEQLSEHLGNVLTTDSKRKGSTMILEIGCGVGNTAFPILQHNADTDVFVFCCDFSYAAIQLLRDNSEYDPKRCQAFVCDVTQDWQPPFQPNSLHIVVMIFVLSAIHPDKMSHVVAEIYKYLRPGGLLVFRDYGRHDMAQLRFKKGRCLSDNFYVRGDGTRVYFFTQTEVKSLFEGVGFEEVHNIEDRRLQVNRGKLLTMYRVWIQAKYRKPC
ncbi:methyltransferase-like protein 2 isoform X2 [Zootermopsis nevadensis]|uniref:methyltransferase-like protein 2 isoform X2 n=1 Tax=Zootermopsis nevadensis TaxID=136037 RepID=UPI000B8E2874|nr:methyltransferase-like protein 2 isoform X2 [Zootermopsis nevadensis]